MRTSSIRRPRGLGVATLSFVGATFLQGSMGCGGSARVASTRSPLATGACQTLVGSGQEIVDDSGNVWTLSEGVVLENGTDAGYSAHVIALVYAMGNVYQENDAELWWVWSGGDWVSTSSPACSVGDAGADGGAGPGADGGATPSPDCTVIAPGGEIVDGSGNVWTISGGVVLENGSEAGYSANVIALAYVKGEVYQENEAGGFWGWSGGTWVAAGADPTLNHCGDASVPKGPMGTPISAPLSGTVTRGTWQAGDINVPGVALPSGKPFHYNYLLPDGYDPTYVYPVLVHEHEDYEGSAWYEGANGDPLYLASASGADAWYNDPDWRRAYPCIVVLPYADQSQGGGDGDDAVENFGGWVNTGVLGDATTFSGDTGPNVFAVAGLVQSFLTGYSANPQKVYITGDSLGGIGSWYMILMYNRRSGSSGKLFTAALPFAGVLEMNGFGSGPTAAQVAALRDVPVFAVSGAYDTTSNPGDWNQPMWSALAGNTSYPGPPSGALASGSAFHYLEDPGLGHDVWDTYRPLPAGKPMYDWLFSQ